MYAELDSLSHFKRMQMDVFGFSPKDTGTESVPWQRQSRYHYVSFVIYFSGAKFEEHWSNISGDILD